ncbi:bola-like protein [Grosmannia clavigera kw1407]|uniref:Bola-like protein n=1 Tax=Grosmannia clavigera (strain kw1407 / UAMH 11150) TaxID=655863 RepID=F0XHA2_GROCL|nr:bola-like protein [Grosmannia clavigera kw1407]EFX02831.1 bola-like protein [Grosmannia clavigera kw1407]
MICNACRQAGRHFSGRRSGLLSPLASALPSSRAYSGRGAAVLQIQTQTQTASRPASWTALQSLTSGHRRFSAAASSAAESATASSSAVPPKPDFLDEAESKVWDLLCEAFTPVELSVRDISGGCGSMYGIEISSERFRGANMLKQQRMVNAVLGDLMKDWHGVQLKTRVP